MNHPDFIVCSFMGNSIGLKRIKFIYIVRTHKILCAHRRVNVLIRSNMVLEEKFDGLNKLTHLCSASSKKGVAIY